MSTLTTILGADTITSSRTVINTNFSNLNADKEEISNKSTDTAFTANSDTLYPSQKAVKAYVDGVGVANATATVRGVVEVATQAQVDAGTALGETGASIVVTPSTLKASQVPIVRTYLNAASPATWTKPAGLKYIVVEVQAAGGGGGGSQSGTGQTAGGGGGGGYSRKLVAVASLGATETVTIGVGGAGGSGNANGSTGETSSFGSHASATGGGGGVHGGSNGTGGGGGIGSLGDLNTTGDGGSAGDYRSADDGTGGTGGSSYFGGGSTGVYNGSGNAGGVYGGGGAGAADTTSSTRVGGVGGAGIVIVTEYYS